MADKTDKVKAMIEKNTDKLTDIQDKVDEIIEITSHLKQRYLYPSAFRSDW